MKLTKVEMVGFKSFAQRTEFSFGDGITAVVGPNGCGKSNLVDAIQWALGETRPTKLRSSGMADVVYRGNATTVDGAEVSLVFDNSSGRLTHPSAEVKVTRRLSKEGDGEYRINDAPAKLKEIKDLFLDTGLGVGGYSFMAQGQIDAILRASPTERRVLLEEAAGTSRYRARRKEAVRRLDRTDQDLQRANDLLIELERQVRSLKVQAGRARTYVEKRDRMRCVLSVLLARRRRELSALLAELEEGKSAAQAAVAAGRAELSGSEEALATRDDEQQAQAAAISDLRTTLADRRARSEHLAARLAELSERSQASAAEREEGGARRVEIAEQIEELVVRYFVCDELLEGRRIRAAVHAADYKVPAADQYAALLAFEDIHRSLLRWWCWNEGTWKLSPEDVTHTKPEFEKAAAALVGGLDGAARLAGEAREQDLVHRGFSADVAATLAHASTLRETFALLAAARAAKLKLADAGPLFHKVGRSLYLDTFDEVLAAQIPANQWERRFLISLEREAAAIRQRAVGKLAANPHLADQHKEWLDRIGDSLRMVKQLGAHGLVPLFLILEDYRQHV